MQHLRRRVADAIEIDIEYSGFRSVTIAISNEL